MPHKRSLPAPPYTTIIITSISLKRHIRCLPLWHVWCTAVTSRNAERSCRNCPIWGHVAYGSQAPGGCVRLVIPSRSRTVTSAFGFLRLSIVRLRRLAACSVIGPGSAATCGNRPSPARASPARPSRATSRAMSSARIVLQVSLPGWRARITTPHKVTRMDQQKKPRRCGAE
jgi:hypothetical protein